MNKINKIELILIFVIIAMTVAGLVLISASESMEKMNEKQTTYLCINTVTGSTLEIESVDEPCNESFDYKSAMYPKERLEKINEAEIIKELGTMVSVVALMLSCIMLGYAISGRKSKDSQHL